MSKIKPEDLKSIGEKIKRTMLLREGSCRVKIIVHMGTCGIAAGARNVMKALTEEIEKADAKDVLLTISSCAGLCSIRRPQRRESEGDLLQARSGRQDNERIRTRGRERENAIKGLQRCHISQT